MMNADNLAVSAAGVSADAPGPKSLSCCESSSLRHVAHDAAELFTGSFPCQFSNSDHHNKILVETKGVEPSTS